MITRFFRNVWRHLYSEHLSDPFKVVSTFAALFGYFGLWIEGTWVIREQTEAWPGNKEFALYLYITYFTTMVVVSGLIIVASKSLSSFYEGNEQRSIIFKAQHRIAEVLRRNTSIVLKHLRTRPAGDTSEAKLKLLQDDSDLHSVFADVLKFLEKKLNRSDITLAVKYISGEAGERKLDAVVRYPKPETASVREDSIEADKSVVYAQFLEGNDQTRWVLVRDVRKLPVDSSVPSVGVAKADRNAAYQHYARKCRFQSVVGFPLRNPRAVGTKSSASNILGFLSLDCPDPNAFDALFLRNGEKDTNDGQHFKDGPDLQFFFGLADSLATLAILGAK